jgi:hypothetical protein
MHHHSKIVYGLFTLFFILLFFSSSSVTACKDIIATGNSTAGEYNLLLKVRDPSRPGLQVLTHVPQEYNYTYHHPWTGKPIEYHVYHSYIGVASEQDVPPNIVKSGMALTDAGLAFGDADSLSRWINPTKHAWDDFDWIRYSCEQATTEAEAVDYLTVKAVDELHATGVSENLCVVGPEKGYLIEADAYRYTVKEIKDDVDVISNYPRTLWKTQLFQSRFIAEAYNSTSINTVQEGEFIDLNGIARIQLLQISSNEIYVRQFPFFTNIGYHDGKPSFFMPPKTISLGESKTVGDFYVSLESISGNNATIQLTTAVHAWEQALLNRILPKKGQITVSDMIKWSRLDATDLTNVRPMCEATYPYEGVAIYQIPSENYQFLSKGWFSANHACSSIYVPFHNSNTDIYQPYETGESAQLSLFIYQNYSDRLLPIIQSVEQVFLTENAFFDTWAKQGTSSQSILSDVLTTVDTSMQEQAWLMQQLLYNISKLGEDKRKILFNYSEKLWNINYTTSINSMGNILTDLSVLHPIFVKETILSLMQSTCRCYINVTERIGQPVDNLIQLYEQGNYLLNQEQYVDATAIFQQIINQSKNYFMTTT